jgi:photosystem II stability/assembly factor-like uncharacterized protein
MQSFFAVAFANIDKAYAVGSGGVVFRTSDGGESWSSRNIPTTAWLYGLSFSNANTCTVVGESGVIFRTSNDGVTWQRQTSGTSYSLTGVSFAGSDTGIAVGDLGVVLVTSNGGILWRQRQLPFPSIGLNAVQFTSARYAWAVGDGIYRTSDAGETWTRIAATSSAYGLHFINDDTGVIVGPAGFIYTTNGGASWGARYSGIYNSLYSIALLDINDGVVTGTGGSILRTSSGLVSVPEYPQADAIPDQIQLEQNYPNPFNASTKISYWVSQRGFVSLVVYDVLGRQVASLATGEQNAGAYTVDFGGETLSSGLYFYKLTTTTSTVVRKMLLLR